MYTPSVNFDILQYPIKNIVFTSFVGFDEQTNGYIIENN